MQRLIYFLVVFGIISCVPKEETPYTEIDLTLENKSVQKILNFENKMLVDSIYPFLNHVDPSLRFIAIKYFASQSTDNSNDSISSILSDPSLVNKSMAAYAMGQSRDPNATDKLIKAFVQVDTSISVNHFSNRNILEAIGKVGDKTMLALLGAVDYLPADNELVLGQARSIYQFALRGIFDDKASKKMINYTLESQHADKVRELASAFLSRSKQINVTNYKSRLSKRFLKEKNVFVRMNIATVLGRTKDKDVMRLFLSEMKLDGDYRVKINMVKSMEHFPYINIIEPLLFRLKDKNIFVAQAAADMLHKLGNKYDASIYQNYINDKNHYSLNAKLISAVLHHLSPKSRRAARLVQKVKKYIKESKTEEQRMSYIKSLAYVPVEYKYLIEELKSSTPPGKTALIETLTGMYKRLDNRNSSNQIRVAIFNELKSQMQTLDIAAVSLGSLLIADKTQDLKSRIGSDGQWLKEIKSKLKLPEAIEAYKDVSKAIAYVNGMSYEEELLQFNHPIDWNVLLEVDDSTGVIINTNEGSIHLELYPMHAPQSVSNFVKLVKEDYYREMPIHRVAPNFVIQAGCKRGDGYGGVDYVIQSEFGDKYYDDEGYLGMASAGKNTESTQWFITHRPTPHLDGKYTIFGKVTKGMDVVHSLKQGDVIKSIDVGEF